MDVSERVLGTWHDPLVSPFFVGFCAQGVPERTGLRTSLRIAFFAPPVATLSLSQAPSFGGLSKPDNSRATSADILFVRYNKLDKIAPIGEDFRVWLFFPWPLA